MWRACWVEGSWFPLSADEDVSAAMRFSVTVLSFDGVMEWCEVGMRWWLRRLVQILGMEKPKRQILMFLR